MRASELENCHNYVHLPIQLLTIITNNNHDLLFTTVPHQGQNKDSRGQFPGFVVAIRAPNEGAPLPTLCLLYNNYAP